ncbi:MAG: aminomethyl-transferring glycine dehydrogenase subunit GcvPA [Gammaproteobacteria bacterium]|nr:aminomethyl-transferring glycine dehydrogenase subunit GcvPA [Gammaproteobacteria bacterium]
MPFIPHTEADIQSMLAKVGVSCVEDLFDEIPGALRCGGLDKVADGLSEMEINRLMLERAEQDGRFVNFIGAGAYEHHIPAAVWELTTRGEFYSAYTPYQAEASQGTLQLIYEFQTMITGLTGLDVANASLYDGASGLAEAVLMAVRAHKKRRRILMPTTVHPVYRQVVESVVTHQDIAIEEIGFDQGAGVIDMEALERLDPSGAAALVIPQPNFFGGLEDVDGLTDWAHANGMLVIALVNPTSLALLKPPGKWGEKGADIAVGEGQPLGAPLSSGGPYFGFMCCKQKLLRQMPGRIVGRTVDMDGRPGFTLTLQAREQHIRRSKATSNICTNQGLLVTAATIYMALLGPQGLAEVARRSHANTRELVSQLSAIKGVEQVFDAPYFHEAVLRLDSLAVDVLRALEAQGIIGGLGLKRYYPELGDTILVCATETRTGEDIARYAKEMERIISKRRLDPPCAQKVVDL